MTLFRTMLAGCAIAAAATITIEAATAAESRTKSYTARANEFSAAKRTYHHRYVRRYHAPPHYSAHRRGNDPSIGPNGAPYRVPAYLRNQCHIDEGYGRFSACPNE